jgi:hypothetical protein
MSKTPLIALLLMLVACVPSETVSSQAADEIGRVNYFDFEIDRITGILEEEMGNYGCLYEISRSAFDRSVLPEQPAGERYDSRDVRAKVVFSSRTIYIDRRGIAKAVGGEEFSIRKDVFVSALTAIGRCDPR